MEQIFYSNHKKLEPLSEGTVDHSLEAAKAQIGLEELLEENSVMLDATFAPYKGIVRQYSGEGLTLFHHQQRSGLAETNFFIAQGEEKGLAPIIEKIVKLYDGCGYITDVHLRQLDQ